MARKLYESAVDLKNEEDIVTVLADIWCCDYSKLPLKYGADYALHRDTAHKGQIFAVLEVKKTSYLRAQYDNYMVSLHKAERCVAFAEKMGVSAILAIRFKDALGYVRLDAIQDAYYRIGGRYDRNDPDDVEIMLHIPILQNFKFL